VVPVSPDVPASCPTCRVCGHARPVLRYHQRTFDVWRCGPCGSVFVVPNPMQLSGTMEHLDQIASEEGERYMREVFIDREAFWLRHWTQRVLDLEARLGRVGRLLDIGCAMGHFQLAAEQRGWQTVGVELSEPQVRYARNVLHLDVRAQRFEEAGFEPQSFDVVTLWSVIEHVPLPCEFLAQARTLLRPDGLLVLQTPNQGSLITRLADAGYRLSGGRFLLGVYSLDHIFRFDTRSLRFALQRSGFGTVEMKQHDNLDVMLARMSLQPRAPLRHLALRALHAAAAAASMRNQLVAFARPDSSRYEVNAW
jgi:2-polyprenyl-3-methyl-5-hydroxy-6-metoxy-1,4-benzoquinol methylase